VGTAPTNTDPGRGSPPSLIITDGGLGGLLAAWAEGVCAPADGAGPGPVLWFAWAGVMGLGEAAAGARLAAARRQAELCHASDLVVSEAGADGVAGVDGEAVGEGLVTTHLLLAAAAEAARRGFRRVVWPVHLGGAADREAIDLHAVADACDRALLVGQLMAIDLRGGREVRIETPYVDFTDVQMAELALDLDVPRPVGVGASWCETGEAAPRGCACAACRRWEAAFLAAGGNVGVDAVGGTVTIGARGGAACV